MLPSGSMYFEHVGSGGAPTRFRGGHRRFVPTDSYRTTGTSPLETWKDWTEKASRRVGKSAVLTFSRSSDLAQSRSVKEKIDTQSTYKTRGWPGTCGLGVWDGCTPKKKRAHVNRTEGMHRTGARVNVIGPQKGRVFSRPYFIWLTFPSSLQYTLVRCRFKK